MPMIATNAPTVYAASPGVTLDCALVEAAAARSTRRLRQLARQSVSARVAGGDAVATLARSASAIVELETLLEDGAEEDVDLCLLLNRVGVLVQLALPTGSDMVTSFASANMPGAGARALAAAVLELADVAISPEPGVRPRLFMRSVVVGGGFAVVVGGSAMAAVPDASATRRIARAGRIVALLGGRVTRGYERGMHVATVALRMACGK